MLSSSPGELLPRRVGASNEACESCGGGLTMFPKGGAIVVENPNQASRGQVNEIGRGVRFVQCIGPGLASISHGGQPVIAYDHRFSSTSHDLRMHSLENSSEGPRRVDIVVIRLSRGLNVGVMRDDRGRPRTDGVVALVEGESVPLCFEMLSDKHVVEVFFREDPRYPEMVELARATEREMFACFEQSDCAEWEPTD